MPKTPVEAYCQVFRDMRRTLKKLLEDYPLLDPKLASVLWFLQMAHQVKKHSSGKCVFFMDTYYTCHIMAVVLNKITNGDAYIIGTVRLNNIDATNKVLVLKGISMIKDMHRGAWVLVRAHDKVSNYDELKKQHLREQKMKKIANCLPFTVPVESPADRAGYILFKDNKVVCFYTNDLEKTLPWIFYYIVTLKRSLVLEDWHPLLDGLAMNHCTGIHFKYQQL